MRMLRPVVAAAALGAALLCGSPPAHAFSAENLPSVSVSPDFAEPRETVSVTVTCRQANVRKSVVTSDAFDPVTMLSSQAGESIMSSTTVIRNVPPGRYRVTSTCDGSSTSSTTLTILPAGAPHMVPQGGARTGGGSMAPNRQVTAAGGGALLASGLGLLAITLRRRLARR
ncbi:MAG TPA: hypothetical protein VGC06_23820 [Actinomycetes bacterium]